MAGEKEYIVDLQSVRVDFPDTVNPESPAGALLVLEALKKRVERGESIVEYFEVDEFEETSG
jgi:hypothetical protein